MRFLPSLRTKATGPSETKSWDLTGASLGGMLAQLRSPRSSWTIERAVAEGMERVIWVFKSVNAIGGHSSDLRLQRVRHLPGGDKEILDDDALTYLLNQGQANELEKGTQLTKRLSAQVSLSPRGAFVELTFSRRGEIVGADLLPPGRTRPVPGRNGKLLSHYETVSPDGRIVAIPPEKVRWFRDPHPLDPFRAISPMEAAGLSVDLDFLARLYNTTFLRNDGRPGGVIGIDGEVEDAEIRRIENAFGKGAHEAGKITVLEGDLSYIDLGAKPRDLAYKDLSKITKDEILAAFGTPESIIGNASGRTFANAEQEADNFWRITMPPHLKILTSGWDYNPTDDVVYEFDLSGVEVLQRSEAARRAEAREEFKEGLITHNEYRARAGYPEWKMPHARAAYIGQSRTPIPTQPEDAVALGLAPVDGSGVPAAGGDPTAAATAAGAGGAVAGEQPEVPAGEELAQSSGAQAAIARLQALLDDEAGASSSSVPPNEEDIEEEEAPAEEDDSDEEEDKVVRPVGTRERKSGQVLPIVAARQEAETVFAEVLGQLGTRLVGRTVARLKSPKLRKGSRHFTAEYAMDTRVGADPLNVGRIVPADAWRAEAEQAIGPAVDQVAAAVVALTATGDGLESKTVIGRSVPEVGQVSAEVTAWAASAFEALAGHARSLVAGLDADGVDMPQIIAAVRGLDVKAWAERLAVQGATAVVNGAAGAVAEQAMPGAVVVRRWRVGDGPGEPHQGVEGQVQADGDPFVVGGAEVRWPGDVLGPVQEGAGCRCWVSHALIPA
ncbi:hypothetical protein GCM10022252_75430 [Streptosporangium oxazolinicum]|uniref:Phage portal protein n=1 Tax=Streptosporangium oxazolinicum TaxID=909287 RepID=A0ABP8BKK1_9ACTN